MKRFIKRMLLSILIILIIVISAILVLGNMAKERAENYYKYTNPVGAIETKYTSMGSSEVLSKEITSENEKIGKFIIYYPGELEKDNKKFPVVLWANGTGSKAETYKAFLKHLSSWGFITVATDDENSRTGESLNASVDLLLKENEDTNGVLYQKIDVDNIGVGGHSQGGPAVFNMATVQPHADMIKTVYAVSATSSFYTNAFKDGWQYDISKVKAPTFLTSATGTFDAGTATSAEQKPDDKIKQGITPLWSLEENFNLLPDNIDKVYARKKNVDHGDSYLQFDGYMTAWFRFYLANDKEAGDAFYGEKPELSTNTNYQDFKSHKEK